MATTPRIYEPSPRGTPNINLVANPAAYGAAQGAALENLSQGIEVVNHQVQDQFDRQNELWARNAEIQAQKQYIDAYEQMRVDADASGDWSGFSGRVNDALSKIRDQMLKNAPTQQVGDMLKLRLDDMGAGYYGQSRHMEANQQIKQQADSTAQSLSALLDSGVKTGDFTGVENTIKDLLPVAGEVLPADQVKQMGEQALAQNDANRVAYIGARSPDDAIDGLKAGTLGGTMSPEAKAKAISDLQEQKQTTYAVAATNAAGVINGITTRIGSGNDVPDGEIAANRAAYIQYKTTGVSAKARAKQSVDAGDQYDALINQAKAVGLATSRMIGKDPATLQDFLVKLHEQTGDSPIFKQINTTANNLIKQANTDPATYAVNDKTVMGLWNTAQQIGQQNGIGSDFNTAMNNYVAASLDVQRRAGIPTDKMAILTNRQVNDYRAQMLNNPENAQKVYQQVTQNFGDAAKPIVLRQLFGRPQKDDETGITTQVLPPMYDLIGMNPDSKPLWDAVNTKLQKLSPDDAKTVSTAITRNDSFQNYAASLTAKGGAGVEDLQRKQAAISQLASYYKETGMEANYKDAVNRAISNTIDNNYVFADAGRGRKISLTRDIAPTPEAATQINTTLGAIALSSAGPNNPYAIVTPDNLDPGLRDNYIQTVAQNGYWSNDGDSVVRKVANSDGSSRSVMVMQNGRAVPWRVSLSDVKNYAANPQKPSSISFKDAIALGAVSQMGSSGMPLYQTEQILKAFAPSQEPVSYQMPDDEDFLKVFGNVTKDQNK